MLLEEQRAEVERLLALRLLDLDRTTEIRGGKTYSVRPATSWFISTLVAAISWSEKVLARSAGPSEKVASGSPASRCR